ncbi:MAG: endonuclease/exonuclease/phosphatase family protein, partial [Bacteroidota bacterium]|nr:endonuclease/exonuclease/phosphatase family protein [Bacteroidota bacterium]
AQSLMVGSYNIRCVMHSDKSRGDVWNIRYPKLCSQINFIEPDIFGTQEASDKQIKQMLKILDNYSFIGVGRDNGKKKGEHSAIFYNKEKYVLLDKGNFWLNESPDKPAIGWDAAKIRICSWGKFKEKNSGKELFFFNLHLDHKGKEAIKQSSLLVIEKIKEIAKESPVVLSGDFNSDQNSEAYNIFSQSGLLFDTYDLSKNKFVENGTYNAFNPEKKTDRRIDHIFVSKHFLVDNYAVLTDGYWTENTDKKTKEKQPFIKRTFSDHYPIFVKLKFKE